MKTKRKWVEVPVEDLKVDAVIAMDVESGDEDYVSTVVGIERNGDAFDVYTSDGECIGARIGTPFTVRVRS